MRTLKYMLSLICIIYTRNLMAQLLLSDSFLNESYKQTVVPSTKFHSNFYRNDNILKQTEMKRAFIIIEGFGFKGGLNFSNQIFSYKYCTIDMKKNITSGLKIGAFSAFSFSEVFSIVPGLIYDQKGYIDRCIFLMRHNNGKYKKFKTTLDYLSINLPVKLQQKDEKLITYFSIGPHLDILIGKKNNEDILYKILYDGSKKLTLGYVLAFGCEFYLNNKINIFMEFEANADFTNSIVTEFVTTKNSFFSLAAGIKLKN